MLVGSTFRLACPRNPAATTTRKHAVRARGAGEQCKAPGSSRSSPGALSRRAEACPDRSTGHDTLALPHGATFGDEPSRPFRCVLQSHLDSPSTPTSRPAPLACKFDHGRRKPASRRELGTKSQPNHPHTPDAQNKPGGRITPSRKECNKEQIEYMPHDEAGMREQRLPVTINSRGSPGKR